MALLEVTGVEVRYGAVPALHDFTVTVEQGEIVTLLGANGAGKTTTLRMISGLHHASLGSVRFDGIDISHFAAHKTVQLGISHVPEGRRIFAQMTVLENLEIGSYNKPHGQAAKIDRVFGLFPVLKDRRKQQGGNLSGGEQQMLAIARALMMKPRLLILDEPTLGLAPVILDLLSKAIERLRQTTPITMLLGEQNVTFALPHADRVYVLEHARIVWEGDPARFVTEASEGFL